MAEDPSLSDAARRLRRQQAEWQESQKTYYGEEEHERREEIKQVVISALKERINPLLDEAKKREFVFFDCDLDRGSNSMPIVLQFGDGKGAFYERRMGIRRLSREKGLRATLGDWVDMKMSVHSYVRNLAGIQMLERGMKRRRVRSREA